MEKHRLPLIFAALVFASLAASCGASASSTTNRQLLSITLSPATADAANFPDGQVAFTATGTFNNAPHTVTPLTAGWGVCSNNVATTAVTVSSEGVAKCAPGAVGTFTVLASDVPYPDGGANCLAITPCGGGCLVTGTAQLTCPK
jgi:hypothetical protein